MQDVEDAQNNWVDYEREETSVKLDVADMIVN